MNYFENQATGTFIECGAADGISICCCKFFEDKGWKGINIEGENSEYQKLCQVRKSSLLNLNAALTDHDDRVIFNGSVIQRAPNGANGVRAVRLSTAMSEAGLKELDLLCLDIEGHEPVVFADMMRGDIRPKVICAEYPHCTLKAIHDVLSPEYSMDGISFNNVYFSLKDLKVRRPFWGRTCECYLSNGQWVFPEKAEY